MEANPDYWAGKPAIDKRVRRALNYALDVPELTQALYGGNAHQLSTYLPRQAFGSDPSLQPYVHDEAKAKALLAEAAYADGFTMKLCSQLERRFRPSNLRAAGQGRRNGRVQVSEAAPSP